MDDRKLNEIPVTWQLVAVLVGFLFGGIALMAMVMALLEHRNKSAMFAEIAGCIAFPFLGLAAAGIWSRWKQLPAPPCRERKRFLKQMGLGFGAIALGVVAGVVSYLAVEEGGGIYFIPTGMIAVGVLLLARAMVPTQWEVQARRGFQVQTGEGATAPAALPPRPGIVPPRPAVLPRPVRK